MQRNSPKRSAPSKTSEGESKRQCQSTGTTRKTSTTESLLETINDKRGEAERGEESQVQRRTREENTVNRKCTGSTISA